MEKYLQPTNIFDSGHPLVLSFTKRFTEGAPDELRKAVRIYYAVRDGWRYNPYNISLREEALKASTLLMRNEGHCLDKSVIMIACLRAAGIPARIRLAKVRNHIAIDRIVEVFGTDELVPHGIVEVYLKERWVKATPAFNQELCNKLGVQSLEFDGTKDALFQQFDQEGNSFMEYLEDYGHFAELPVPFIVQLMREHYPNIFQEGVDMTREKFLERLTDI